jgi:sugar phosphate isomerase/epimerase
MKLGIGTYAYMWSIGFPGATPEHPMTALDLLAKARELGVRVVQIGPNLPLDRLSEAERETVLARAHEWQIELEIGTRGLETEHLRRYIALTTQMGATLLRTIPEVAGSTIPPLPEIADYLRAIIPDLAAARVRLAMENGKIPAEDLDRLLVSLASPWLGITLDTVNSLALPEGTEHVAQTLARHTMCLHLKEFVVQRVWHMMGFTVEGRPTGKGQLNIPWLLETLRAAGVSPNAILELWPPEQKTLQETIALEQAWAVESISYLRQYIPD